MENTNSQAQSNQKEIIVAAVLFLIILGFFVFFPLWLLTFFINFYLALTVHPSTSLFLTKLDRDNLPAYNN